jgi:hypothetical protein
MLRNFRGKLSCMKTLFLTCPCGAKARNTTKERGRFKRRHPSLCSERFKFTKQLATGTRSVDADVKRDFEGERL